VELALYMSVSIPVIGVERASRNDETEHLVILIATSLSFKYFPGNLVDRQALRRHIFALRIDDFLSFRRHPIGFRHRDIDSDAVFLHGLNDRGLSVLR
jgi:hypothetical protein